MPSTWQRVDLKTCYPQLLQLHGSNLDIKISIIMGNNDLRVKCSPQILLCRGTGFNLPCEGRHIRADHFPAAGWSSSRTDQTSHNQYNKLESMRCDKAIRQLIEVWENWVCDGLNEKQSDRGANKQFITAAITTSLHVAAGGFSGWGWGGSSDFSKS